MLPSGQRPGFFPPCGCVTSLLRLQEEHAEFSTWEVFVGQAWKRCLPPLLTDGQTDCKEPGKCREDFAVGAMGRAKRLSHGMQN